MTHSYEFESKLVAWYKQTYKEVMRVKGMAEQEQYCAVEQEHVK